MPADYSLTGSGSEIPLQCINDTTYGTVQIHTMKRSTTANVIDIPIPTSGPDVTIVIDLLGAKRTITFSGIVKGTVTQIDSFVNAMEALIDSNQYSITQTSPNGTGLRFVAARPASTAINVILMGFDWEYVAGIVSQAEWSCTIQQGNS